MQLSDSNKETLIFTINQDDKFLLPVREDLGIQHLKEKIKNGSEKLIPVNLVEMSYLIIINNH